MKQCYVARNINGDAPLSGGEESRKTLTARFTLVRRKRRPKALGIVDFVLDRTCKGVGARNGEGSELSSRNQIKYPATVISILILRLLLLELKRFL